MKVKEKRTIYADLCNKAYELTVIAKELETGNCELSANDLAFLLRESAVVMRETATKLDS